MSERAKLFTTRGSQAVRLPKAYSFLSRMEQFDADHDTEALARFDELMAAPPTARFAAAPSRAAGRQGRRMRSNAATAHAARLDTAITARDFDALPALLADEYEVLDHTTGVTWDRQGELSSYRALRSAQDPTFLHEPMATLGDSLLLCRLSTSASAFLGRKFDVGAHEREVINVIEVDARGRRRRVEVFATERLDDAVARLYERYAELLPDGPAHTRAAATARSVAVFVGPDPGSVDAIIAPDGEYVDHRPLGFPTLRGADAIRRWIHSLFEAADDVVFRLDDVLGLRSDAFLVRWTNFGTHRAGGGSFERRFIALNVFGVDGLVRRWEFFDADRDAEALARSEELTAAPAAARPTAAPLRAVKKRQHRVRANAATASAARFDAVFAARDADALPTPLADEYEVVDHTTGVTYDRQGELSSYRDPSWRTESLATLGDSLELSRLSMSASGFVGGTFDVGAYGREHIGLGEIDAQGRLRRAELFAVDRLGDAVVRLYERYADLLPDGPARARAAATAHSVTAMAGPLDLDRYGTALAPAFEFADHRTLGLGRGAEAWLRWVRSFGEVAADPAFRIDDVLDLRSDALLVRWTTSATDRVGGGAFENQFLQLWVLGPDGLLTRIEWFDTDRDDEALARFDELMAEPAPVRPTRRVRANAATAHASRLDAAIGARDADALPALLAATCRTAEPYTPGPPPRLPCQNAMTSTAEDVGR